jgi:hypothetical protein
MPVLRNSIVTLDWEAIVKGPVGVHSAVIAIVEAMLAPEARAPLFHGRAGISSESRSMIGLL